MCIDRKSSTELFWANVDKNGPTVRPELGPCWLWTASTNGNGYGQLMRSVNKKPKMFRAHRFAWQMLNGPLDSHQHLLHSCDVPLCVNPAHLRIGTPLENRLDCISRGRTANAHTLTAEQVLEIRASSLPQTKLARIYGVNQATISDIKNRVTWKGI